jgi:hypothetical protein
VTTDQTDGLVEAVSRHTDSGPAMLGAVNREDSNDVCMHVFELQNLV